MRTTLSLDPDVAAALRQRQRAEATSWKQVVNDVLRDGLRAAGGAPGPSPPAATEAVSLGGARIDVTNVHAALAIVEGERRR